MIIVPLILQCLLLYQGALASPRYYEKGVHQNAIDSDEVVVEDDSGQGDMENHKIIYPLEAYINKIFSLLYQNATEEEEEKPKNFFDALAERIKGFVAARNTSDDERPTVEPMDAEPEEVTPAGNPLLAIFIQGVFILPFRAVEVATATQEKKNPDEDGEEEFTDGGRIKREFVKGLDTQDEIDGGFNVGAIDSECKGRGRRRKHGKGKGTTTTTTTGPTTTSTSTTVAAGASSTTAAAEATTEASTGDATEAPAAEPAAENLKLRNKKNRRSSEAVMGSPFYHIDSGYSDNNLSVDGIPNYRLKGARADFNPVNYEAYGTNGPPRRYEAPNYPNVDATATEDEGGSDFVDRYAMAMPAQLQGFFEMTRESNRDPAARQKMAEASARERQRQLEGNVVENGEREKRSLIKSLNLRDRLAGEFTKGVP